MISSERPDVIFKVCGRKIGGRGSEERFAELRCACKRYFFGQENDIWNEIFLIEIKGRQNK